VEQFQGKYKMTWRIISNYDPDAFKAKRNDKGELLCINCGRNISFDKRRTKFCSTECVSEYFKCNYKDWTQVKFEVFTRDNWNCKLCGVVVRSYVGSQLHSDAEIANCDHIIPLWKGGKDWVEDTEHTNLQTLCEDCHKKKSKQESKERTKLGMDISRGIQRTMV